ncbi:hypothetical protein GOV11_02665 [Candidatus Woesearchaeota archaeon]|nr:hypothetical protein [Candidatus Woesearchaeota archaeon]
MRVIACLLLFILLSTSVLSTEPPTREVTYCYSVLDCSDCDYNDSVIEECEDITNEWEYLGRRNKWD